MKKILLILALLFSVGALAQMKEIINTPPSPPKLVNDYTNTLTSYQKEALENKLYRYDDSTSNQITVVVVKSSGNYSIEDAAIELGRSWGVGSKDFNNGVVVLVAIEDRKTTIQVGYGLEGAITDLVAKSIIDNTVLPNFKQGNYYRGLDEATNDLIKAAAGRYKAPAGYSSRGGKKGMSVWTIIVILIILGVIFGAGGNTTGGGMMSRRGYRGWWGPTWTSGGGDGGGWSGGGGGGGFGGFGGGSFGGGGASGSW
jgi:uncharacterized protein